MNRVKEKLRYLLPAISSLLFISFTCSLIANHNLRASNEHLRELNTELIHSGDRRVDYIKLQCAQLLSACNKE